MTDRNAPSERRRERRAGAGLLVQRAARLLFLSGLAACRLGNADEARPQEPPVSPFEVDLETLTAERWDEDRPRWRGHASHARVFRNDGALEAEQVRLELFEANGVEVSWVVESARGQGGTRGKPMVLEGAVRMTDAEGRVLTTERVIYDGEQVTAPGAVQLVGENFVVRGASAAAWPSRELVEVRGPVWSEVRPEVRPETRR